MARAGVFIRRDQKTLAGEKAEPTLVRARMYVPPEEYEELDEVAINRIWTHLRKEHWEDLKETVNENQFFSRLAQISSKPFDRPLQNVSRKDSNKVFKSYMRDIGWVEKWTMTEERRDYYRSLIEQQEFDELKRIHSIKVYWHQVRILSGKMKIPMKRARTVWTERKRQREYWSKERKR